MFLCHITLVCYFSRNGKLKGYYKWNCLLIHQSGLRCECRFQYGVSHANMQNDFVLTFLGTNRIRGNGYSSNWHVFTVYCDLIEFHLLICFNKHRNANFILVPEPHPTVFWLVYQIWNAYPNPVGKICACRHVV